MCRPVARNARSNFKHTVTYIEIRRSNKRIEEETSIPTSARLGLGSDPDLSVSKSGQIATDYTS